MKVNWRSVIILICMVVAIILVSGLISGSAASNEKIGYSELIEFFDRDLVTSFDVDQKQKITVKVYAQKTDAAGNLLFDEAGAPVIEVNSRGEKVVKTYTYSLSYSFQLEEINNIAKTKYQSGTSNLRTYNYEEVGETPWYQIYLPYIFVGVLLVVFWIFMMRQTSMGGGKINSFSKSHAKITYNDKNAVKFADVAGAEEEKAELEEIVDFLKDPSKYVKLGARIPRGVLLVGPPGTGKTLLAKAVAGEAGVPFFSISGSDFVEMYVGVGASRVRDLFDSARRANAAIIFIDEIDAVGRHRGAGLGGGHDEREQTLNQLLVEMDGFGTQSGVIVMAATNRPDILDPALLRPGRFDRTVRVGYPDMKGREEILKVHCRNKPLEATVDLHKIAQSAIGFTGAELANLMNEAALLAAKKNKALIGMDDIEASYMKILLGPQKKTKQRRDEDNRLCAYHEAGHAVASYYCKFTDPVKHITIIPAGDTGGVTVSVPTEDRLGQRRQEMLDHVVLSLGGRVAESIIFGDISTGASSDIQQATKIIRNMVVRYGMSDKLGTILYGNEHSDDEVFLGRDFSEGRNYSEKTAAEIDDEIRNLMKSCYDRCYNILIEHRDKLEFVAQFLLKNETMDEEQFRAAMESENPSMEAIENIAEEKVRRSEAENKTQQKANEKAEEEKKKAEEAEKAKEESSPDDFFDSFWRGQNPKD